MKTNWKRKLAAYLHDPPSKALDIRTHGERSDAAFVQAGALDTEIGAHFSYDDAHPGGWLPNWVFLDWDADNRKVRPSDRNGQVLLKLRSGKLRRDYSGPRARRVAEGESAIGARLVAAIVPKPMPVTGWALANDTDRPEGGAKSTHLAVPAGAVYFLEAEPDANGGPGNAVALAVALNWHGSEANPTTIKNRRSTLLGEKGFGLGVCGTWNFFA